MSFDADDVNANIRRNVLSNYIALVLRMLRGVVLFRLLYSALSAEQFGYWSLLWSVFGFGILLDFGFGLTIQRSVARSMVARAWDQLNEALSTIFVLYCGLGALLGLLGLLGTEPWMRWVNVPLPNRDEFRTVFHWFVAAMALKFPLTVFPEILRAQQRGALLNWITIATSLVGLCLIVSALWLDWGFPTVVAIAVLETLVPAVIAAYFAYRYTPTLRLRLASFSRHELSEAAKFSVVAYFIMLTYMATTKTDLLVISTMLSLPAAAAFQPGAKVAEIFSMVIKQLPDVMQPAAAHLYARKDHQGLQDLQRNGIRFSAIVATPLWVLTAFYMPWLIVVLTGVSEPDMDMVLVGEALAFWAYGYVVAQDVYKRIALMGGQEKRLMWTGLVEASTNLGLSVLFVTLGWGMVGVAVGTLLPGTLLGWACYWRWSAQQAGESYVGLIRSTVLRTWLAALPLALLLWAGQAFGLLLPSAGIAPFVGFLVLAGLATLAATMLGAWQPGEREMVVQRLPGPLRRLVHRLGGQPASGG